MRIAKILLPALIATALAACASGSNRLTYTDYKAFYSPYLVNYVAREGSFPLEMYGQPFGASGNTEIANVISLPAYYRNTPFKEISGQQDDVNGRLVLLMDPMKLANSNVPCAKPNNIKLASSQSEQLIIQATFCYQDEMVSQTVLTMDRPASVTDPSFRLAMNHMTETLFRSELPDGASCGASKGTC